MKQATEKAVISRAKALEESISKETSSNLINTQPNDVVTEVSEKDENSNDELISKQELKVEIKKNYNEVF